MIQLPEQVTLVLNRLENAGFEAFIVGGCVRDHLLQKDPSDYDITTSALPEQIETVFADQRVIETGLKHGTVTVLYDGFSIEITTYRLEGVYSDHRHPDHVFFTRCLRHDLSRRDFTINAMAYHPQFGLVDYFGGQQDLKNGVIRCVGDASQRFTEDALRIMRALRFSSVLGFELAADTGSAALVCRELLQYVSMERIAAEFVKLLCGRDAARILINFADIIGMFIPEILPMNGMQQHNPHHIYDLLTHTAYTVAAIPAEKELRLAAFFHDIAKPACFCLDANGIGHYYGHAQKSAVMTNEILMRLRFDNATCQRVQKLVSWHDDVIPPEEKAVKRALQKMTPDIFFQLLELKRADAFARNPKLANTEEIEQLHILAEKILIQQQCFSLKDLAVNGSDLIAYGMQPGKALGQSLHFLLNAVINGQVENNKKALLHFLTQQTGLPKQKENLSS